jgi:hypothetical protein
VSPFESLPLFIYRNWVLCVCFSLQKKKKKKSKKDKEKKEKKEKKKKAKRSEYIEPEGITTPSKENLSLSQQPTPMEIKLPVSWLNICVLIPDVFSFIG